MNKNTFDIAVSSTTLTILVAGRFCIHMLAEEQDKVAMVFAGMGVDPANRRETVEWTTLKIGSPVLVGAAAAFDCMLGDTCEQSTHRILFDDAVETAERRRRHAPPRRAPLPSVAQDIRRFGGRKP